jgi:hypothetical protein
LGQGNTGGILVAFAPSAIHFSHLPKDGFVMADEVVVEGPGRSQVERVTDTFFAPSKTFTDILRSASWWMPVLIGLVCGLLMVTAVVHKVGIAQLADNTLQASPTLQAKMAQLKPEIAAQIHQQLTTSLTWGLYGAPVFSMLVPLIVGVILWPVINFAFGGKATFGQVFATVNYAYLPYAVQALIVAVMLFAGLAPENFTMDNMLGTSVGYYVGEPGALKVFLSSIDIFTIWVLVLLSIGLSIVGRVKRSGGYITVFGLWFFWLGLKIASKVFFG